MKKLIKIKCSWILFPFYEEVSEVIEIKYTLKGAGSANLIHVKIHFLKTIGLLAAVKICRAGDVKDL